MFDFVIEVPDTISVQTGTIHGFQGDECEIIISVYNPPPSITPKKEMFLNKKNIINVSISSLAIKTTVIKEDETLKSHVGNRSVLNHMVV